jgi:hypothetical protein
MSPARALSGATLIAALALGGCGASPYTKATDAYGKTVSAGVRGLSPTFELAGDLCYRNAQLEHLQHRLQRDWDWGQRVPIGDLFRNGGVVKVQRPGSTEAVEVPVNKRCASLTSADLLVRKGLAGLDAYAKALTALGAKTNIDGEKLGDIAKSVGDLPSKLSAAEDAKKVTETVVPIGQALGALASALSAVIIEDRLKETILRTHPLVLRILEATKRYVEATRLEALDVERSTQTVLNTIEDVFAASLKTNPSHAPSPAEVAMLYDMAARQRRSAQDTRKSIETFQTLLDEVAKAEADLVACAEGKLDDQAALERVLSVANGIVTQLDALKTLAARKE